VHTHADGDDTSMRPSTEDDSDAEEPRPAKAHKSAAPPNQAEALNMTIVDLKAKLRVEMGKVISKDTEIDHLKTSIGLHDGEKKRLNDEITRLNVMITQMQNAPPAAPPRAPILDDDDGQMAEIEARFSLLEEKLRKVTLDKDAAEASHRAKDDLYKNCMRLLQQLQTEAVKHGDGKCTFINRDVATITEATVNEFEQRLRSLQTSLRDKDERIETFRKVVDLLMCILQGIAYTSADKAHPQNVRIVHVKSIVNQLLDKQVVQLWLADPGQRFLSWIDDPVRTYPLLAAVYKPEHVSVIGNPYPKVFDARADEVMKYCINLLHFVMTFAQHPCPDPVFRHLNIAFADYEAFEERMRQGRANPAKKQRSSLLLSKMESLMGEVRLEDGARGGGSSSNAGASPSPYDGMAYHFQQGQQSAPSTPPRFPQQQPQQQYFGYPSSSDQYQYHCPYAPSSPAAASSRPAMSPMAPMSSAAPMVGPPTASRSTVPRALLDMGLGDPNDVRVNFKATQGATLLGRATRLFVELIKRKDGDSKVRMKQYGFYFNTEGPFAHPFARIFDIDFLVPIVEDIMDRGRRVATFTDKMAKAMDKAAGHLRRTFPRFKATYLCDAHKDEVMAPIIDAFLESLGYVLSEIYGAVIPNFPDGPTIEGINAAMKATRTTSKTARLLFFCRNSVIGEGQTTSGLYGFPKTALIAFADIASM
jgi:hypothetical protein